MTDTPATIRFVSTCRLFSTCALLAVAVSSAQAQSSAGLTLTPSQPFLTAVQGQTVTFAGTLTNTGPTDLLLNADFLDIDPPLTADDALFVTAFDAPDPQPVLAPGTSYTGGLFTITAPPFTPPGDYFGVFAPEGGALSTDTDILAVQDFTVHVVPVPEASSALGLTLGLALLGGLCRARPLRAGRKGQAS